MGARRGGGGGESGGGGGESGGGGRELRERCEPNRSPRERCFCLMLLEMTRGPVLEGGEGCGDGVLGGGGSHLGLTGGGTHCFCK